MRSTISFIHYTFISKRMDVISSLCKTLKHNSSLHNYVLRLDSPLFLYSLPLFSSTSCSETQQTKISIPSRPPTARTKTPLEKQFETWIEKLKPGFTTFDVAEALRTQSDPDLALDIFRWTSQQRNYKHDHITYFTMIQMAIDGKRFRHVETLIDEVLVGVCSENLALYNLIIRFCCSQKRLFSRAFDAYKKMQKSNNCKPSLETFSMLLNAILRRFNKSNVCYVYLHTVRSLVRHMKLSGVIPDTFVLNLIIKAYSRCLEMDEAIRVFKEMGLYGCEPNRYTYGYIAKGLCEKGKINQGFEFYREMRRKEFVGSSSTYGTLICALSLSRRLEDAVNVVFDMLENSMVPDLLTYKTLLEEMSKEGKGNEAFDLLEELKNRGAVGDKNYSILLDRLFFLNGR